MKHSWWYSVGEVRSVKCKRWVSYLCLNNSRILFGSGQDSRLLCFIYIIQLLETNTSNVRSPSVFCSIYSFNMSCDLFPTKFLFHFLYFLSYFINHPVKVIVSVFSSFIPLIYYVISFYSVPLVVSFGARRPNEPPHTSGRYALVDPFWVSLTEQLFLEVLYFLHR